MYIEGTRDVLEFVADTPGDAFELLTGKTVTGREGSRGAAGLALVIPGLSAAAVKKLGKFLFRGDNAYKGGAVGTPISDDVSLDKIVKHLQNKKTGDPFVSFSTRLKSSASSRGAVFLVIRYIK